MTQPTGVMWMPMPAVGCWIGWLGADAVFRVWVKSNHMNWPRSQIDSAQATILNPFHNMEYKIIKKIRQYTTWISGHSKHKSHSQSVQWPSHCLHQQWRHNPIQLHDVTIATQRTLLRARVNGNEIVLKSTDQHSNLSLFPYVQGLMHGCLIVFISRVIRWNCFGIAAYITK